MTIAFGHEQPWFIDRDDGTIMHIFNGGGVTSDFETGTQCPEPSILFEQNVTPNECDELTDGEDVEIPCSIGTVTRGEFEIDLVDPLPADFGFNSGTVSRFTTKLTLFLEEFTPSRVGEPTALINAGNFNIIKSIITRYDFVNLEVLGTSNGATNQIFTVSGSEILTPTKGTPIIQVENDGRWSVVDDLSESGSDDKVFEYDEDLGKVTFGDGENGKIPINGGAITLKITIRNGGGQWQFAGIILAPEELRGFAPEENTGLNFTVGAGVVVNTHNPTNTSTSQSSQSVVLEDDETNFVEIDASGVASTNTSGFTPGSTPVAVVETAAGEVTDTTDSRDFSEAEETAKNIGNVKSVKDKIFYVQSKIAAADVSKMTTVTSKMNVHHSRAFGRQTGALLAERYVWSAYHGGEFEATGGNIFTFNTDSLLGFVDPKVSQHPDLHGVMTIDPGTTYPSLKGTADATATNTGPNFSESVVGRPDFPTVPASYFETTPLEGGAITDPKKYRVDLKIYPIVQVVEIIRHGVEFRTTGNPTSFIELPAYWMYFTCWTPHQFETIAVLHRKFGLIFDSDGSSQSEANFKPIVHGREARLTAIADLTGTFEDPIHPEGIPDSTLDTDGYTLTEDENTKVSGGLFVRKVSGDITRHPEWVTLTYKTMSESPDSELETHIMGAPFSTFSTTWTAEQDEITIFDNTINIDCQSGFPCSPNHVLTDGFGLPVQCGNNLVDPVFVYMRTFDYPQSILDECFVNPPDDSSTTKVLVPGTGGSPTDQTT